MIVDWLFSIMLVLVFVACFFVGKEYQSMLDDERDERRTATKRVIELQQQQRREQS